MSGDKDRHARSLAHLILDEDRALGPVSDLERATKATVRLEMEGMITSICRNIRFDAAVMSTHIEDELRRQCANIDVGIYVTEAVKREVARVTQEIDRMIRARVDELVRNQIDSHVSAHVSTVAKLVGQRVIALAFTPKKDPKPKRRRK